MVRELKEKMPPEQVWDIVKYIKAMMTEFNPTDKSRKNLIQQLMLFSKHFKHQKLFKDMTRDDVVKYLDSGRKSEEEDPIHKWIGSYNIRLAAIKKFYRWFYYPNVSRKSRIRDHPAPAQIQNLYKLERKEQSIYTPDDLWTPEEDAVFLKYCPYEVIKCYHAMSRDTSARPHELLNRRCDEVIMKMQGGIQYGELVASGKTAQRPLPLFNSIPYVKEWTDKHPLRPELGVSKVPLFVVKHHNKAKRLTPETLYTYYVYKLNKGWNGGNHHYPGYFRQLLKDTLVPAEDKKVIAKLLNKPWNPYIRRHSALTDKAKQLSSALFNQHGGWTPGSRMPGRYVHFFAAESSTAVLEAEGIIKKKGEKEDVLKPKMCPACHTPNAPDANFCSKETCRSPLTLKAIQTMKQNTEKEIESMVEKKINEIISRVDLGKLRQ
jgi:hypothetical protein